MQFPIAGAVLYAGVLKTCWFGGYLTPKPFVRKNASDKLQSSAPEREEIREASWVALSGTGYVFRLD